MALASSKKSMHALLSTVVLVVVDVNGKEHLARALLDTGSQPNAITEHLCQMLQLPRRHASISINGVNSTTTSVKHAVTTEVRSRVYNYSQTMEFLVLKKVTENIPSASFSTSAVGVPSGYVLADPDFGTARRVDMIIGTAYFYKLLRGGQVHLRGQAILLVDTVFGWIVTGEAPAFPESRVEKAFSFHIMESTDKVQEQLELFWKVEELAVSNLSPNEQQCEQYFKETTSRDSTGMYIAAAQKRFRLLETRLSKDTHLKQQYDDFMREYVLLGHMFPVHIEPDCLSAAHYLPHHPVVKEASTTTKVRVVFDGSAKTTTGNSLNDVLLVGPVVQDELLTLVVRFRKYEVAVIADIEKMYRQVSVHPEDRRLQSEDEGAPFPLASEAVKKNLYVDDLISGAENIEQVVQLREELTCLMEKGGFRFRKWCSNKIGVLDGLSPDLLGMKSSHEFYAGESVKTLGISWEPPSDTFRFTISLSVSRPYTKRSVLSSIAQLYDPLGLISPVIV
ncbi:uncharacterized protein LOC118515143 [Anopheles stephensi]|uniref:uncharacterized protein LOC118515143 n=1 Tax=Anopheles stephensi TaxID=30069 RepID=UPI0016589860|nr:uncharacterized protein LOC118515143 [Anopheles stephensi]